MSQGTQKSCIAISQGTYFLENIKSLKIKFDYVFLKFFLVFWCFFIIYIGFLAEFLNFRFSDSCKNSLCMTHLDRWKTGKWWSKRTLNTEILTNEKKWNQIPYFVFNNLLIKITNILTFCAKVDRIVLIWKFSSTSCV